MEIMKLKDYQRIFKKITKRHILTKEIIEDAIEHFHIKIKWNYGFPISSMVLEIPKYRYLSKKKINQKYQ